ncbi:MAG: hypothetical protein GXP62_12335 [Oligoflexia bacterium]|nr:hypothetical protein [Oligoflexia bacterium]
MSVAGLCAGVLLTNSVSNSFVHRSAPGWYFWVLAGVLVAEFIDVRAQVRAHQLAQWRLRAVHSEAAG